MSNCALRADGSGSSSLLTPALCPSGLVPSAQLELHSPVGHLAETTETQEKDCGATTRAAEGSSPVTG